MAQATLTNADLHWKVLTIKRPGLSRDLPAGKEELMWVANSSTLIYGGRDAVLVDTDAMLEIYPDRVNPGSLWSAANIAKKQR